MNRPVPATNFHRRLLVSALWAFACASSAIHGETPPSPDGIRGFLAVRGERIVASQHADRLFTPASVNKLVVAAAALHHLGPGHRITTVLRAGGGLDGTTLGGDLILEAAGDPTWSKRFHSEVSRAPLESLARRLAASGVGRINGDLVVDIGRFPGRSFPTSRPPSEYAYGYAAPTSGFAIDENTIQVEIAPGPRLGAPGTARLIAGGAAGAPRLINHIHTVSKARHGVGTVDFLPVWEDDTIVVRGEYPISEPSYVIDLSVPSPERHAARHFLRALETQGILVEGDIRLERGTATRPGSILARFESPALTQRLEPILTDSHNWHAEMLSRLLAAEVAGAGRLDEGLAIEQRFLEDVVGCPSKAFHLDDASGLSPYNLITPRCVVELLRYVSGQPWHTAFSAAMTNSGEGTLAAWRQLPTVTAKTGSIRNALALAGYLDPESPQPVIFAIFFNHQPGERGPQRAEIARLLRRWSGPSLP